MKKSILGLSIVVIGISMIASFALYGCKAEPEVIIETVVETVTETVEVEAEEEVTVGPFTVGVSNGLITHSWRTQMTSDLVKEAEYYKGLGLIDELLIQHAGFDVDLQINQIRNLINIGVDLLLINPNSQTALDPVIEEAHEAGIVVIVFDQSVSSEYAIQLVPDQILWMSRLAEYVFDRIGGEGDVVYLSGYDGSPANTDRDTGFTQTLEKYPDINLLTKANGNWDPSTAQQAMADVLAAFPKIDGVVSQDGQCIGVINACEAANRELPILNGEGMLPFMEYWMEQGDEGFESFATANGPGFTINIALGVGMRLLQGKELKDDVLTAGPNNNLAFFQLGPDITNENVEETYNNHMSTFGIADYIDSWYSQDELDALFK